MWWAKWFCCNVQRLTSIIETRAQIFTAFIDFRNWSYITVAKIASPCLVKGQTVFKLYHHYIKMLSAVYTWIGLIQRSCGITPNVAVSGEMDWNPPIVRQWVLYWDNFRVMNIDDNRINKSVTMCSKVSNVKLFFFCELRNLFKLLSIVFMN